MNLFQKAYDFTRADEVKAAGFYPYFRPIEENEGPVVHIEGRPIVMAGSNNYLGLTSHPKVKEAAIKAIEKYGTGCSGSRYLTGTIDLHNEFEEKLANLEVNILGPYGLLQKDSKWALLNGEAEWAYREFLINRITRGTPEVMRNIIATRGLGLPR